MVNASIIPGIKVDKASISLVLDCTALRAIERAADYRTGGFWN